MKQNRNTAIEWDFRIVPINNLKFYPKNPRKNTKEQEEKLRKSIEKFGVANPECVNADGTVIGGNFRLKIYRQLGFKEIPSPFIGSCQKSKKILWY